MKLSASTRALLEDLARLGPSEAIARCEALGARGEAVASLALLPMALDTNSGVARAAATAIARLVRRARTRDLVALDRASRDLTTLAALGSRSFLLRVELVAVLAGAGPAAAPLLALASFHRNGYARAAAVRALANLDDPLVFPLLVVRLNDPVPAVRAIVTAALPARIERAQGEELVRVLPLVEQAEGWVRAARGGPLEGLRGRLASADGDAALRTGLRDPDPDVRQACARALARRTGEGLAASLEAALEDPDPRARLWAAKVTASRRTPPELLAALAPRLMADRSAAVRRAVVGALGRVPDGEDRLARAALDTDDVVRYRARVAAATRGFGGASRERALDLLAGATESSPALRGALGALHDVGRASDWVVVSRFVDDPRARVRAEALRALAGIDPAAFVDVFLAALRHASGRVQAEALRGIERAGNAGVTELRAALADPALRPATRAGLAALLQARPEPGAR